jgi:hypothetical protein
MSDAWELAADGRLLSESDVTMCFGDDTDVTGDAEFASWLRGMPEDIRADYLSRPLAGPLETEPAGFHHHEAEPGSGGIGFAAGGPHDTLPPGPDLASLAAATDAGRAELGESALIGVLCAWQRLTSWAQAGQAATLMTLVRRREAQAREMHRPSLAEHVSDEVAAALRLTSRSANQILAAANGVDRLPDVCAALKGGEIDWAKACVFVDQLTGLSDDDAREIAASLLGRAGGMTSGQLRAALTRAVLAHDPEAAERRRKEARTDSGVHTWTETSGNAALAGRELATADVVHASVRLTAFARWLRKRGATGTMDQLRAAVYIALLTGRAVDSLLPADPESTEGRDSTAGPDPAAGLESNAGPDPTAGSGSAAGCTSTSGRDSDAAASTPQPATGTAWPPIKGELSVDALAGATGAGWPQLTGTVNLTMPMSTWLGLTRDPGEVASIGPVDAETCRQLGDSMDAATRWCLTLTDPAGQAVTHACASTGQPPTSTGPPRDGPTASGPTGSEPTWSRTSEPKRPSGDGPITSGPANGLTWAAGLASRLQHFETAPCLHIRSSVGYKPSQSLRHLVVIRQRRCSFPGCRRPAARSDLDHTIPFDQGGLTCECNLSPLCRRHHQAKQAPRWHLEQSEPGRMTWRLPSGRLYQTTGDPY